MNESLKYFLSEKLEKYQTYVMDKIYDFDTTAEKVISNMIENSISGQGENAYKHIIRRHLSMEEKEMVDLALISGQSQATFAFDNKNIMTHDNISDIKGLLVDAFIENSKEICIEQLKTEGHMRKLFSYDNGDVIGIGIDANFNLVSTSTISFACATDLNPMSDTWIGITTAYPDLSQVKEVLKTREELIEEYGITEKQMHEFKFRKRHRENFSQKMEKQKEEKSKDRFKDYLKYNFNR